MRWVSPSRRRCGDGYLTAALHGEQLDHGGPIAFFRVQRAANGRMLAKIEPAHADIWPSYGRYSGTAHDLWRSVSRNGVTVNDFAAVH
jgi:hypothetical protein